MGKHPNSAPSKMSFCKKNQGCGFNRFLLKMKRQLTGNRHCILFMVFIAMLVDNMLLTAVVPIIPDYLYRLEHPCFISLNRTNETLFADSPLNISEIGNNSVFHEQEIPEASNMDLRIGLMFGSKAAVQLITNPIVVRITNRIGYRIPYFIGLCLMCASTIVFAVGEGYPLLFVARSVQGFGSAFTSVSGMGMIAGLYKDDGERGRAMGIALSGLALGVLFGPPFGGVLYGLIGKMWPFLILALLAFIDGVIQMIVLPPQVTEMLHKPSSFRELLKDKYILIAAGAITVTNMGIAMLEPALPLWMMETMGSTTLETGLAFLPASIAYLIGANIFGPLSHKIGRWLSAMIGMLIVGASLLVTPLTTSVYLLIPPLGGIGIGLGMVDGSMMPKMGYLADTRHSGEKVYGLVYAIADMAFCLGFAIGPTVSGTIVNYAGFSPMIYTIGVACLLFAPLLILLKKIPMKKHRDVRRSVELERSVVQKF